MDNVTQNAVQIYCGSWWRRRIFHAFSHFSWRNNIMNNNINSWKCFEIIKYSWKRRLQIVFSKEVWRFTLVSSETWNIQIIILTNRCLYMLRELDEKNCLDCLLCTMNETLLSINNKIVNSIVVLNGTEFNCFCSCCRNETFFDYF